MAKIGRNQPCPCGSGSKYKRCCWHRDRAAHVPAAPAVSPHGYHLAETDLDRLSNSVVKFIDEGRLDEADAACEQLRTRYPEVHDWLMRKAMVCEARGETQRAIEYFERTIAWMDAHPENFGPKAAIRFARTSSVFEARSEGPAEPPGSATGRCRTGSAATRRAGRSRTSRRCRVCRKRGHFADGD